MDRDEELENGQEREQETPSETSTLADREAYEEARVDAMAEALGVEDDSEEGDGEDGTGSQDGGGGEADRGALAGESADDAGGGDDGASGQGDEGKIAQEGDDLDFLTPPEGLKARAKERFDNLANRYRERDQQYRELEGQAQAAYQRIQAMTQEVQSTRATPEKFNAGLEYMRIVNDPNASEDRLRAAKRLVESELAGLNRRLGEASSEQEMSALVAQFPDIREALDNMEIEPKLAVEIAGARMRERQRQQAYQQSMQAQQAEQGRVSEFQGRAQAGGAQINQWHAAKVASDPSAQRILQAMRPALEEMARTAPPENWVRLAESQYVAMRQAMAAAEPPPSKHQQPLSGSSASAGRSTPKTSEEALLQRFGLE